MSKSNISIALVKKLISQLGKTQDKGAKTEKTPSRPRSSEHLNTIPVFLPRSLQFFLLLWLGCLVTLPLDLIVAPVMFSLFADALAPLTDSYRELLLVLSLLLMAAPLMFREQFIHLLLSSQEAQSESQLIASNFQGALPTLIAMSIGADLLIRTSTFGWKWTIGVLVVSLLAFPFWYRHLKQNIKKKIHPTIPQTELKNFVRALRQFELLYTLLLVASRLGAFLSIGFAHTCQLSSGHQVAIAGVALLLFFSAKPTGADLHKTCRRCGYRSHRTLQIEGKCPGCHKLGLKSYTLSQRNKSHTQFYTLFERFDNLIEQMEVKLNPKNWMPPSEKQRSKRAKGGSRKNSQSPS